MSFDGLSLAGHLLSQVAHESGLTFAQTEASHGGVTEADEQKAAPRLLQG